MSGSFGVWTRGTLQSRALPLARSLRRQFGLRSAIVTTPWDAPDQAGRHDSIDGVEIVNTSAVHPFDSLRAAVQQARFVRDRRAKIHHVFKPKGQAGLAAQMLRATGTSAKTVVDVDDWEGDGGWNDTAGYNVAARRLFAFQERHLISQADAISAASTLLMGRVRALNPSGRVLFLPNGLESGWIEQLARSQRSTRPEDSPQLLLYSRFAEFSLDWMIAALGILDKRLRAPVRLNIVGDGSGKIVQTPFDRIQVVDHGYVDRGRLPDLLGGCKIALYPYADSLVSRSKQSAKLLELMAAGCAIVASDVGDIRRIGGGAVEVVQAGDASAFAARVAAFVERPELRLAYAREARDRTDLFNVDNLAARLYRIYTELGISQ